MDGCKFIAGIFLAPVFLVLLVVVEIIVLLPAISVGFIIAHIATKKFHNQSAHVNGMCPMGYGAPVPSDERINMWCLNFGNSMSFSDQDGDLATYIFIGSWYLNPFLRMLFKMGLGG